MKFLKENSCTKILKEEREDRLRDYQELIELDKNHFNEDGINDWALGKVACRHNYPRERLRKEIKSTLTEATLGDKADLGLENDVKVKESAQTGLLKKTLTDALEINLRLQRIGEQDRVNVWVESEGGAGKTSIIKEWAKEHNVNLYTVVAATLDESDIGGLQVLDTKDERELRTVKLRAPQFDALERPRSVLFLDELNRARPEVRAPLLKLIGEQVLPDASDPSGFRHFDNLIFVIAATNPVSSGYDTYTLDRAERTRFKKLEYEAEPLEVLKHLKSVFNKQLEMAEDDQEALEIEGKLALAEKILTSPKFSFDDAETAEELDLQQLNPTNSRTFKMALNASRGTKKGLLDVWNEVANPKKRSVIETILGDYKDVKDKANKALTRETKSSVFTKAKNPLTAIQEFVENN